MVPWQVLDSRLRSARRRTANQRPGPQTPPAEPVRTTTVACTNLSDSAQLPRPQISHRDRDSGQPEPVPAPGHTRPISRRPTRQGPATPRSTADSLLRESGGSYDTQIETFYERARTSLWSSHIPGRGDDRGEPAGRLTRGTRNRDWEVLLNRVIGRNRHQPCGGTAWRSETRQKANWAPGSDMMKGKRHRGRRTDGQRSS